jgi:phosphoribosylanthranilate isomerase
VEDALMAVAAGADAIGLNFYSGSSRVITPAQAREITEALPPMVTAVGLFVNMAQAQVRDIAAEVALDLLQFHGDESEAYCAAFDRPWIKALRVHPGLDLASAVATYRKGRGILLDAWHKDAWGGTGHTFDWQMLAQLQTSVPVVLAGGLNPGNVQEAVRQCSPWAVDVSSGVESAPGIKSPALVAEFIARVRAEDSAKKQAAGTGKQESSYRE